MRGNGDVRAIIIADDIVKHSLGPRILVCARLREKLSPVWVFLGKPLLELKAGEVLLDVRLAMTAIASMRTDTLSQKLLDDRHKGVLARKRHTLKVKLSSVETAVQRTRIESLGRRYLFVLDEMFPEGIYDFGLLDTGFCKLRISPRDGAVAVQLGPVAVPRRGAKVGLSGVMEAFTVAAHEEEGVAFIARCLLVQGGEVVGETLPLGCVLAIWVGRVAWVGSVN